MKSSGYVEISTKSIHEMLKYMLTDLCIAYDFKLDAVILQMRHRHESAQ